MRFKVLIHQGDYMTVSYGDWTRRLAYSFVEALNASADDDTQIDSLWENLYRTNIGSPITVDVDPAWTVRRLRRHLAQNYGSIQDIELTKLEEEEKSRDYRYHESDSALEALQLVELPTLRRLELDAPLSDIGLHDGDVIGLLIQRDEGIRYLMDPAPNPAILFERIRSSSEKPPQPEAHIWGALLYTDEDEDLATYVRKYFTSLNRLSGRALHIFVIEEPNDWEAAKRYWKQVLTEEEFLLWSNLQWLHSVPYDKSQAYEIAQRLGVFDHQLPCLVLFDRLERKDKLIFPIHEVSPAFFRHLFTSLRLAIGDSPDEPLQISEIWDWGLGAFGKGEFEDPPKLENVSPQTQSKSTGYEAIARQYDAILNLLRPAQSSTGGVSTAYQFYGSTVFVNRPEGEVTISRENIEGGN